MRSRMRASRGGAAAAGLCLPTAILLLALLAGVAFADSPFEGAEMTATWEYWNTASPGAGGTLVATTDTVVVTASDAVVPDIPGFHSSSGLDNELWDVDFEQDEIRLTYTSIAVQDMDHQYMYGNPQGFHFADLADELPEITDVQVDDTFAPFGFDPLLVSFDGDNIWVDLKGSMCHIAGMPSMPDCGNPASPTGYDNEIVLIVTTVPEPGLALLLGSGLAGLAALQGLRAARGRSRGECPDELLCRR